MTTPTEKFKKIAEEYLQRQSLTELRAYGRFLNLPAPTKLKKGELICEMVCVLSKEKEVQRTKRGAPIKNRYFSATIHEDMERLKNGVLLGEKGVEVDKNSPMAIHLSINIEKLTEKQKVLLKEFLKTLQ